MNTRIFHISLTVLILGAVPAFSAAPVALVTDVKGKVLLNQGDGFEVVEKMATVDVGDQLLVSKDAAVSLEYASAGCASTFQDPALLTVSSSAPCANPNDAKKSRSSGGGGGAAVSGAAQRSFAPFTVPSLGGGGGTTGTTTITSPQPISSP